METSNWIFWLLSWFVSDFIIKLIDANSLNKYVALVLRNMNIYIYIQKIMEKIGHLKSCDPFMICDLE